MTPDSNISGTEEAQAMNVALDPNALAAAVRHCARLTAPHISDEVFERHRAEGSERFKNTADEIGSIIAVYLLNAQKLGWSIPLSTAVAEAEKTGFLSVEDLQRLAAPALPQDVAALVWKLNGAARGLCTENAHDYFARGLSAGDALEAASLILSQSAALASAREVMAPFVEVADRVHERTEDDRLLDVMTAGARLTIGDFRAARAWLSKAEGRSAQ